MAREVSELASVERRLWAARMRIVRLRGFSDALSGVAVDRVIDAAEAVDAMTRALERQVLSGAVVAPAPGEAQPRSEFPHWLAGSRVER